MATRRIQTHSKSRNGCIRCKARRLKCDEERPVCLRCARSGKECIYQSNRPENTLWNRAGSIRDQPDVGTFDALDLLFMHHYTVHTARELVGPKDSQSIWQNFVPTQAYAYPTLMHGLLALAGIDMARQHFAKPEVRHLSYKYRARALSHQQTGLRMFQKSLACKVQLPQSDLAPLILFNLVLIISTFAIPITDDAETTITDVLSIFALCRGAKEVFAALRDPWLRQLFKAMMFVENEPTQPQLSEATRLHLEKCLARQDRQVNRDALEHLMRGTRFHSEQNSILDVRMVAHWPAMCSDEFMEEIRQLKPDSLFVLAQYSHVLNMCRGQWWVNRWPELLLRAIDPCLEQEDKARLGWDLEANLAHLRKQDTNDARSP